MSETDMDGATDPGTEGAWPETPGEFAARWNSRSEASRHLLMHQVIKDGQTAMACTVGNHVAHIAELEAQLALRDPQDSSSEMAKRDFTQQEHRDWNDAHAILREAQDRGIDVSWAADRLIEAGFSRTSINKPADSKSEGE